MSGASRKPEPVVMTPVERCAHYNASRFVLKSGSKLQVVRSGRIEGIWNLGANFRRNNPLHGSYLGDYFQRVETLFPEATPETTVHLFSGGIPIGDHYRVDIVDRIGAESGQKDAQFVLQDIHSINEPNDYLPWDRDGVKPILWPADPPYWNKDCDIYGCEPVNRRRCFRALADVVPSGSFVVWLDPIEPQTRKADWEWYAAITLRVCAGHQGRFVSVYRRK